MTWRQRARQILGDVLAVPALIGISIAAACVVLVQWVDEQLEREP